MLARPRRRLIPVIPPPRYPCERLSGRLEEGGRKEQREDNAPGRGMPTGGMRNVGRARRRDVISLVISFISSVTSGNLFAPIRYRRRAVIIALRQMFCQVYRELITMQL